MSRINDYHALLKKKTLSQSQKKTNLSERKGKKQKTTYIQTLLESKRKIRS